MKLVTILALCLSTAGCAVVINRVAQQTEARPVHCAPHDDAPRMPVHQGPAITIRYVV